MATHFFLVCTLLSFSLFYGISAAPMKYVVILESPPDHGGIEKFNKIIGGIPYTKQIMGQINKYICAKIFRQNTPADRKTLDTVTVFIKDFIGREAVTWGDVHKYINVSAVYLRDYAGPMDLKWEFTSLLHHELTHVFQWFPWNAPIPFIEGIADYTILKANYFPPGFMAPGSGDRWDKGYDYTARFLEYCDTLVPDFVAKLNNMMRKTYDVSYFQKLTGKPVEQLWRDYKAKYAKKALEEIQG